MNNQKVEMNPYLNARREWNERYGSYLKQAQNWKLAALISSVISLIAVIGLVMIGQQNKIVPYVVQVDQLGQAVAVGRADQAAPADERIIKAMLAKWIVDFRTVMVDGTAQKSAVDRVYAMLLPAESATAKISEYYQSGGDPFSRAANEIVSVEISSVLPISEKSWQVEWTETQRNRQGVLQGKPRRMKAAVNTSLISPKDDRTILRNPIGLYVTDVSWTTQL